MRDYLAEIELEEVNVSQDGLASAGGADLDEDQEDEGEDVKKGREEGEVEAGFGGGFDGLGAGMDIAGVTGRRRGGGGG